MNHTQALNSDTVRFTIFLPRNRMRQLQWSIDFVLASSGCRVEYKGHDAQTIVIEREGKSLSLRSVFPNPTRRNLCLNEMILPTSVRWIETRQLGFGLDDTYAKMPILFGDPVIRRIDNGIETEIDLIGGIFFLLSGVEEVASDIRDRHDRFPGAASLAAREGFLDRAIADEYREIVLVLIENLWPDVQRSRETGNILLSCDVDEPFDRSRKNMVSLLRKAGGDIFIRRQPGLIAMRVLNTMFQKTTKRFDPCYTFDWYLDLCDAEDLKATFYFIAENGAGPIDGDYALDDPQIAQLFRDISERGHGIGMHGSYLTFRDLDRLKRERSRLTTALDDAGVSVEVTENRQHYLRWDALCTPDNLEAAGFQSDSSGGFADLPGFRYGTARSFPMWSWQKSKPLRLIQKPLVVMENSLLSEVYMDLDYGAAARAAQALKSRALAFGGDFSILWHNSELYSMKDRNLLQTIVACPDVKH